MKRFILILMITTCGWVAKAQTVADTSLLLNMFSFHVSGHLPGGDLAQRYGMNLGVGGSYMLKLQSQWMFSAEFSFFSGNDFKEENIFNIITDDRGSFINIYGETGEAAFYERGFYAGLKAGRLFPIFGPNPNSGLMIMGSAGLLQYKTLIHHDGEAVPLLTGDYTNGFDHLSNGFATSQFIGYMHLDSHEPINFYAGFEFHQGWTKNRRDYNFDIKGPDDTQRKDFLFGIKFGWIFPINKRTSNIHYYY